MKIIHNNYKTLPVIGMMLSPILISFLHWHYNRDISESLGVGILFFIMSMSIFYIPQFIFLNSKVPGYYKWILGLLLPLLIYYFLDIFDAVASFVVDTI